jgi:hypothetical protein
MSFPKSLGTVIVDASGATWIGFLLQIATLLTSQATLELTNNLGAMTRRRPDTWSEHTSAARCAERSQPVAVFDASSSPGANGRPAILPRGC